MIGSHEVASTHVAQCNMDESPRDIISDQDTVNEFCIVYYTYSQNFFGGQEN